MVRRGDAAYVSHFPTIPGLEVAGTIRASERGRPVDERERVVAFTESGGLAEVAVADARVAVAEGVARLARRARAGLLIGVVGATTRVAAARRAGDDHVLVAGEDLAREVLELTDGRGVDAVLDPKGAAHLEPDLAMLAPQRLAQALRRVLEAIAGGDLDPQPTVLGGLAAAPDAQHELADGRGAGKRVVRVKPSGPRDVTGSSGT